LFLLRPFRVSFTHRVQGPARQPVEWSDLRLAKLVAGPVVSPTFPCTAPHATAVTLCLGFDSRAAGTQSPFSYTSRLSPAYFQPHDARRSSRGSMQCNNCSLFGLFHLSAYYIYTLLPLSARFLYNATFALNSQKWISHISCQCIRYREAICALVRTPLRNVVTDSNR
jgi:hypothetical protein